ncbi:SpoIIE family protein phosphatase [Lawsonia intracellularis]|uniref:SpoIIE family protein phosphatase n=1 Tax=Lawsonia intracellularis TaxID=29546 RepID=UPI0002EE62C7|nr:SpoIIE family protein phosphatase [Lawsonia intracellularis]UYH53481.1 SpoIIE family protein phosphatase [Lawsonia intracellularis]
MLELNGVTEAMAPNLELYGTERFEKTLDMNRKKSLKGLIAAVNQTIIEHRGEAEQSDDITMLAFMYK